VQNADGGGASGTLYGTARNTSVRTTNDGVLLIANTSTGALLAGKVGATMAGPDDAGVASLTAARTLRINAGATAPASTFVVRGIDLYMEQWEPEPPLGLSTGPRFILPWPTLDVSAQPTSPDDVVPVHCSLLGQSRGDTIPISDTLVAAGQLEGPLATSIPRCGYVQISLTGITLAAFPDGSGHRSHPNDTWLMSLVALVQSPDALPLTVNTAGLPLSTGLNFAWVPLQGFLTIPGGWSLIGKEWDSSSPHTLSPGSPNMLWDSEISLFDVASAVCALPSGCVGIGVRSWCYHTYTSDVIPTVSATFQLSVW